MTREGYIEKIKYKSDENGYCVMIVEGEDGEEIFVGTLPGASEGLYVIAEGEYVNHPQYDIQFQFTSCEIQMPKDIGGIERYLGSGVIKGIGAVLAKRVVKKFKEDTLRILEQEPERLAEVNGISERKAQAIAVSYMEKKEFQDVAIFLAQYGISVKLAIKIFNHYGAKVYDIVRDNPYKLAEDITGVGFRIADGIAMRMGIPQNSEFRLRSAILFGLNEATAEGHMYLPKQMLVNRCVQLVRNTSASKPDMFEQMTLGYAEYESASSADSVYEQTVELIEHQLMELLIAGKIKMKDIDEEPAVYLASNYFVELNTARLLTDLRLRYDMDEEALGREIARIEKELEISLDDLQRDAVKSAIGAGTAVITGGPGTGKTTIINVIIKYFSQKGMEIKLAAPTGRAAKRMTESTGWPAQTIHRLLEINGALEDTKDTESSGMRFGRNSENPLECDAIIVDEMSMVDAYIFYSLVQAIPHGTRLILVGDVNQLPSVGAGNVLKDIINSGCFPVTTLNRIFRQEDGSDIVFNAHKIQRGEHLVLTNKSKDFFFIPQRTAEQVIGEVQELTMKNLPGYYGLAPQEIQILCPMRKYEVGVENMNQRLQRALNPPAPNKPEHARGENIVFRKGDKVMQIKNNYQQEWKVYGESKNGNGFGYVVDEGVGVFNGDMGVITDISDYDEELTILFDDGRTSVYDFKSLDQIEHAFAVTIHKSQGSEYPAVIIPLLGGNKRLMNRNLIYTAITRARQLVILVGDVTLVNQMIDNSEEHKRYTSLALRLEEMNEVQGDAD